MDEIRQRFQNLHEIVVAARAKLDRNAWDFLIGGVESETTVRRNRLALDTLAFRPRVLRNVNFTDCSGRFLGRTLKLPVALAPIGSIERFHQGAAAEAADAAGAFGCAMYQSSVAQPEIEETGKVKPDGMFEEVFARDTPQDVEKLRPIAGALQLLKRLHRHRNSVFADGGTGREWGGASGVLNELVRATRAHVGFALRIGGEQALANLLHVTELARQYELGGGISFRGFVEELRTAAATAQAAEAPILEEDSDGVRMMTVRRRAHPIVILSI